MSSKLRSLGAGTAVLAMLLLMGPPPGLAAPNAAILIQGLEFQPGIIVVGDLGGAASIVATNVDGVPHDIQSVNVDTFVFNNCFANPPIPANSASTFVVNPTCDGFIEYICVIHPFMRGAVIHV